MRPVGMLTRRPPVDKLQRDSCGVNSRMLTSWPTLDDTLSTGLGDITYRALQMFDESSSETVLLASRLSLCCPRMARENTLCDSWCLSRCSSPLPIVLFVLYCQA